MSVTVRFTDQARWQLKKIDKPLALLILGWIRKNLEGCTDPRLHGYRLVPQNNSSWRYYVGDYRLICEITDSLITVLAITGFR